jgi:hypothetical protein
MPKLTLYQILGLSATAGLVEVRTAFLRAMSELEARRADMSHQDFAERQQMLAVAKDTLSDPNLRARYDAELEAKARNRAAALGSPLARREQIRADALGLRADALSLRADALLAREDLGGVGSREPSAAASVLDASKLVMRAIGMLTLIGVLAFGITRCASVGSEHKRAQIEARAAEQIRLQEYARTYGVKPANIAELELLEAERQRKDAETRQAEQEKRQREDEKRRRDEEQRRLEQDVRQLGDQVSRDRRMAEQELRIAEQQARQRAERDLELRFREEQLQLEVQNARTPESRARLELQIRQLRERRQQP